MSAILLGLHLPPVGGYLGATERKRSYLEVGPEKERVSASVFRVAAAVSRQIARVLRSDGLPDARAAQGELPIGQERVLWRITATAQIVSVGDWIASRGIERT